MRHGARKYRAPLYQAPLYKPLSAGAGGGDLSSYFTETFSASSWANDSGYGWTSWPGTWNGSGDISYGGADDVDGSVAIDAESVATLNFDFKIRGTFDNVTADVESVIGIGFISSVTNHQVTAGKRNGNYYIRLYDNNGATELDSATITTYDVVGVWVQVRGDASSRRIRVYVHNTIHWVFSGIDYTESTAGVDGFIPSIIAGCSQLGASAPTAGDAGHINSFEGNYVVGGANLTMPDLTAFQYRWLIDEGSGTDIADSGAGGVDGTLNAATGNDPSWTTDRGLPALVIGDDGVGTDCNSIDFPDTLLNLGVSGESFTLLFLVKPNDAQYAGGYPCLWSQRYHVSSSNSAGFQFGLDASEAGLQFRFCRGGGETTVEVAWDTCGIVEGEYALLAYTFDNTNNLKWFTVNGVVYQYLSETNNIAAPNSSGTTARLGHTGRDSLYNGSYDILAMHANVIFAAIDRTAIDEADLETMFREIGL